MILKFSHKYLLSLLFCLVVTLFHSMPLLAQSGNLTEIEKSYDSYSQHNFQEKIYVHTDRSTYISGEILWLKVYLTNALNHQLSDNSKVVYVEIINQSNQPVLQGMISMKDGTGNGSFNIPFNITSGNYILRAYTNRMKNFFTGLFFEKKIVLINTSVAPGLVVENNNPTYKADFLPEGGNLVNGIESVVAFKIVDNHNKSVEGSGTIVDQSNNPVTNFKTTHQGMGRFTLKPESGKQYTAIITMKDGSSLKVALPTAFDKGYVMGATQLENGNLNISIASQPVSTNSSSDIYAIIQNGGTLKYAKKYSIENGHAQFIVIKDNLPEGISQITIFNSDKQPVCERLIFKRPENKLNITINADKTNYATRSKVSMNISAQNQSGKALSGELSASVYRLDGLQKPDQENIYSYFWLSSGLNVSIENANYYFEKDNAETNAALDLLMLTQGWRKFDWKNILENKVQENNFISELGGHIITGRVIDENTKQPVAGVKTYISVPGKRLQLHASISDANGLIHFDMKDFYGDNQIIIQAQSEGPQKYQFEIFSPYFSEIRLPSLSSITTTEKDSAYLTDAHLSAEIQTAYHQKEMQQFEEAKIDTIPFYKQADKIYKLDDYKRFTTMEEVMREYVNEVQVRKDGSDFLMYVYNRQAFQQRMALSETLFKENPFILLDGVPIFDINKIFSYDPLKVQKLDLVARPYFVGSIPMEGVLSYTTYKANLEGYTFDPTDLILNYEGMQKTRIFYSPQYETENARASRIPDFRSLLLWEPNLQINTNNKTSFSFYTGDIPGKYIMITQGISANGDAGSQQFIFTVE